MLVFFVFAMGATAGAVGHGLYVRERVAESVSGADRGFIEGRLRERIVKRLDLTPEEREKVSPVLDELAEELALIRRQSRPRAQAAIRRAIEEIKPLLPSEKRRRLEHFERKMRERGERGPEHGAAPGMGMGRGADRRDEERPRLGPRGPRLGGE